MKNEQIAYYGAKAMDTTEKNKLIAEFMAAKYSNYGDGTIGVVLPNSPKGHFPSNGLIGLRYHESWDWLMPVFVKLRCMDVAYEISSKKGVRIYTHPGDPQFKEDQSFDGTWTDGVDKDLLQIATTALIEFIKWYNENRLK